MVFLSGHRLDDDDYDDDDDDAGIHVRRLALQHSPLRREARSALQQSHCEQGKGEKKKACASAKTQWVLTPHARRLASKQA